MAGNKLGLIVLLLVCFILIAGTKPPKKLIGYWQVVKIERKDGTVKDNIRKFIEFHKDGTMEGGTLGSIPNKSGTWTYDKETNSVNLIDPKSTHDSGIYTILELSSTDLIMMKDSNKVFFEKYRK